MKRQTYVLVALLAVTVIDLIVQLSPLRAPALHAAFSVAQAGMMVWLFTMWRREDHEAKDPRTRG